MSDTNSVSRSVLLRNRAREVLDDVGSLRLRAGAVLILVLVALGVFGLNEIGKHRAVAGSSDASYSSDSSSVRSYASSTTVYSSTTAAPAQLVIYVVGAVKTPGLFTVASNARVSDAVAVAGGLTTDADVNRNNLAAKVTDGERVYLLKTGEAMPANSSASVSSSSSSSTGGSPQAPININQASESELENLPGVGPATAAAIVQYRTQHGAFGSVNDLSKIKGIGPSKLAQIQPAASV